MTQHFLECWFNILNEEITKTHFLLGKFPGNIFIRLLSQVCGFWSVYTVDSEVWISAQWIIAGELKTVASQANCWQMFLFKSCQVKQGIFQAPPGLRFMMGKAVVFRRNIMMRHLRHGDSMLIINDS